MTITSVYEVHGVDGGKNSGSGFVADVAGLRSAYRLQDMTNERLDMERSVRGIKSRELTRL